MAAAVEDADFAESDDDEHQGPTETTGGGVRWSAEEDRQLRLGVDSLGVKSWRKVSEDYLHGKRTELQAMHRWNKVRAPRGFRGHAARRGTGWRRLSRLAGGSGHDSSSERRAGRPCALRARGGSNHVTSTRCAARAWRVTPSIVRTRDGHGREDIPKCARAGCAGRGAVEGARASPAARPRRDRRRDNATPAPPPHASPAGAEAGPREGPVEAGGGRRHHSLPAKRRDEVERDRGPHPRPHRQAVPRALLQPP